MRDCKGAVTVFITLILIPAIIITGTGVDLARISAARSMARNANLLALNATLTMYDALLQDLYGLFAVMQDDEELATMLDVYIRSTLFAEEVTDAQVNIFGRLLEREGIQLAIDGLDPLSNEQILSRQIEEFAKWRAPVAIIADIIERLSEGEAMRTARADQEAVDQMTALEDSLQDVFERYEALRNRINRLSTDYIREEQLAFTTINAFMNRIHAQLQELLRVRGLFQAAAEAEEVDIVRRNSLEDQYHAIKRNIQNIVTGQGSVGSNWIHATEDQPGRWGNPNGDSGLGLEQIRNNSIQRLTNFKPQFDELVTMANAVDQQRRAVETRISNLRSQLDSQGGNMSAGLADGMRETLDFYELLLLHDFGPLAETMREQNRNNISNGAIRILNDIQAFGHVTNNQVTGESRVSMTNLSTLGTNPGYFDIWFDGPASEDRLQRFVNLTQANRTYTAPRSAVHFREISNAHAAAFDALNNLPGLRTEPADPNEADEDNNSLVREFTTIIRTLQGLLRLDDSYFVGATGYTPPAGNRPLAFCQSSGIRLGFSFQVNQYGGHRSVLGHVRGVLGGSVGFADVLQAAMRELVDRTLLVTYGNHMFTHRITNLDSNAPRAISMTGHEFGTSINYFYRTELEFLIAGHNTAAANLRSVSWAIMGIRLLANLVASYTIGGVNSTIIAWKAKIGAIPIVGKVLMWLVRPLWVFGESILDLRDMLQGHAVPVIKTDVSQWSFLKGGRNHNAAGIFSLYYRDYLTIFLLSTDSNTLARRMGNLMMLNVTNVRHNINADRGTMEGTSRANKMDFRRANTAFSSTISSGSVPFLFISQPMVQNDARWAGGRPPRAFNLPPITDYRGY